MWWCAPRSEARSEHHHVSRNLSNLEIIMGQSKQRGSFDERKKQAQERLNRDYGLQQVNIEEFIKEIDLPENSQFFGYVVNIPHSDEYLADIQYGDDVVNKTIAKIPALAKVFDDVEDALKARKEFSYPVDVCLMFETDQQFLVLPISLS
jgi:hypothetical protein